MANWRAGAAGGGTTGTADRTATIVPAVGDLLVVYCFVSANTNDTPTCSDDNGGTYDRIDVANVVISVDFRLSVFVRTALMVNTTSTIITVATGSNSAGVINVAAISGMSRAGSAAVRSKGLQNAQAAGTAAPTLNQSALTSNLTIVSQGSADTSTTAPTNWTERNDNNQSSPTIALETATRDSGFTGTTITYGAASSTAFCSHALELDASTVTVVSPANTTLTLATFAPVLKISIVPAIAVLALTAFAPTLRANIIPPTSALTTTTFAPQLQTSITPANVSLTTATFSPTLTLVVTPATQSLSLAAFAPSLPATVTPNTASLTITTNAPLVEIGTTVTPATLSLSLTSFAPSILPFLPVWLDPGGDAVQAIGYFNAEIVGSAGDVTFDTAQKVVGVGSYKFDSAAGGDIAAVGVTGVLGASRRVSAYFRYDSQPDAIQTATEFVGPFAVYSGAGFVDDQGGGGIGGTLTGSDDAYCFATPAQNAGQGHVFDSFGLLGVTPDVVIDSVKIIYERKYDTDTSIGISRVKYRIDGVEGPDHDNTDQPLTDTVVEVDVTADRAWEAQHLQDGVFEVIAEARRGNTATAHTQSWDYVKVEVQFHLATSILRLMKASDVVFHLAVTPKGTGAVVRFTDGALATYDGITELVVDTWPRISFSYVLNNIDDLDINVYVNGVLELSIVGANTNGTADLSDAVLQYGWCISPGIDHLCWFDQIFLDDGDDLSDCGNVLMTAKLPASVNENNWNTTIGDGSVNERPVSITNGKQHTAITGLRQTYTLQTAATGDVDISGETYLGYMGWAWTKRGSGTMEDSIALIVNGIAELDWFTIVLTTTAALLKAPVVSASYPSDAAGIGMVSNNETADTFMYECGVVQAYEGPPEDILLPFQLLAEDSLTPLTDDLRASPPTSYELCYRASESSAVATITVSSLDQEGGEIQQQAVIPLSGGSGRVRITPGIEVQVSVLVTGGDISMEIWHRLNVDG